MPDAVSPIPSIALNAPNRQPFAAVGSLMPGILLAATLAGCAFAIRVSVPTVGIFSPLIMAMMIGLAVGNTVRLPDLFRPGLAFSMRHLLRLAIVLLGLRLTLGDLAEVGFAGLAMLAAGLAGTFLFTIQAGRLLGVDRKLTELLAAGTSVCGAAAIIAANTVTRARDEDVAYAIATITVFGTIAMFAIPALGFWIGLTDETIGFWAGAAIHEIAQVGRRGIPGRRCCRRSRHGCQARPRDDARTRRVRPRALDIGPKPPPGSSEIRRPFRAASVVRLRLPGHGSAEQHG
jgi:uncharacterized membrane protein YadS